MAAQLPDWIIVNGEFRDLYSNPLEQHWSSFKKRPAFYPLINCTRGYIATWEVTDNQLFLIAIDGDYEKRSLFLGRKSARFTLKTLLPHYRGDPIKATWFSGKLRIPIGNMMFYEHQGYDSRFERELIATIHKGDVIKMVTLDYTKKTLTLNSEILIGSKHESGT